MDKSDSLGESILTEPLLTPREQTVLASIPFGHKQAIGRRRLSEVTHINDRTLREVIYSLVVVHGFPLGSSTGPDGGGYFHIQDKEDLEVATRHLKPRAKAIYRRAQALEKIARDQYHLQLKLSWVE